MSTSQSLDSGMLRNQRLETDGGLLSSYLVKALFVSAFLIAGFFVVDHSPGASTHFRFNAEFIDSENRTADRVESVNFLSTIFRMILGAGGLVFLYLPSRGKLKFGGIISLCLLTYLAYLGMTTFWSLNAGVTMRKFMVLCFFAVAAVGLARQFTMYELTMLFCGVCLFYIGLGIVAEIALGNFTPHKSEYRFVGTCHPNTLAVYGSFCCLAAITYFGSGRSNNQFLIMLFVVGFVTLLATRSRTTLAGFMVTIFFTRFLTLRPNHRVFVGALTLFAMTIGGLFLALSRSNVKASIAESLAMGRTEDVTSLTGRLPLWEELMHSVNQHSLLGHGYLAFWDKQKIDYLSALLSWEIPHGHNMYIDVLLDGGWIGLVLFLLTLLIPLVISFRRCIRFHEVPLAIVFGMLVFVLIHGIAESLFKLPTFLSFILLTLVLRMAITDPDTDESLEGTVPSSIDRALVVRESQ